MKTVIAYLVSFLAVEFEKTYYTDEAIKELRSHLIQSIDDFLRDRNIKYYEIEEITPDELKDVPSDNDQYIFLFEGDTRRKKNVYVPEELLWLDYDRGEVVVGEPLNHPDVPSGITIWIPKK